MKPYKNRNTFSQHTPWYYRLAQQFEYWSFTVTPERLSIQEGIRAALAVAVMVAFAEWLRYPLMSWGAFGAFWTCLTDPGGRVRQRVTMMGIFAVCGTISAWLCSTAAGYGALTGIVALLVLIFYLSRCRVHHQPLAQPMMLVSVVCVVAVTFPQSPGNALFIAGIFLLGSLWAIVLCTAIWRISLHASLRRSNTSLLERLEGMAYDFCLMAKEGKPTASKWELLSASHRRAIRSAIEKTRSLISSYDATRTRYSVGLELADRIFAAMIAVGYYLNRQSDSQSFAEEEKLLAQLCIRLREATRQSEKCTPDGRILEISARRMLQRIKHLTDGNGPAFRVIALSLAELGALWQREKLSEERQLIATAQTVEPTVAAKPKGAYRFATMVTLAVLIAWYVSIPLDLRYSYWATMAVVVVCQPDSSATQIRGFERLVGSIVGGLFAVILIDALAPDNFLLLAVIVPIAAATIALRTVNYMLFVLFLTPLFVLVTELLQPSRGIALARMVDNILGTLIGGSFLWLWPCRHESSRDILSDAVTANLDYAAQVMEGRASVHALVEARRMAGANSNRAETVWRQWWSDTPHRSEADSVLRSLRHLAETVTAHALMQETEVTPEQIGSVRRWQTTLNTAIRQRSYPAASVSLPPDEVPDLIRPVVIAVLTWIQASGTE